MNLREAIDLVELFNSPGVQVTREGTQWHGKFEVEGVPFSFVFERDTSLVEDEWGFLFAVHDEHADAHEVSPTSNTGLSGRSAVRVIGIVVGLIRDFLKDREPDALWFYAWNADGRHTLYARIAEHLKEEVAAMGYVVVSKVGREASRFVIRRASPAANQGTGS